MEGACSRPATFIRFGSQGLMRGARMPRRMMRATITMPARVSLFFRRISRDLWKKLSLSSRISSAFAVVISHHLR